LIAGWRLENQANKETRRADLRVRPPTTAAGGDHGEDLAAAALQRQGYKILERNFVTPLGEIDLVARQGKVLVVVEVKTRKSTRFGSPQEAVSVTKQGRLRRLADYYLKAKRLTGSPVRFDVVAVTLAGDEPRPTPIVLPPAGEGLTPSLPDVICSPRLPSC
jgi:putative endonuclease